MGSTRRLVLGSESNRRNFLIISRFLKDMGWWQYWKTYVATGIFKNLHSFNNGNWFEPTGKIYQIFAVTSFSSYLTKKHHIHIFTVLDLFIVYANILYREELDTKHWIWQQDMWAINYLKKKGLYEKWELERELKETNGLGPVSLAK
jgi:hypothetical protein